MDEYITLTDTPECDLVESYTNEYCYIQEGEFINSVIGKDKQESMIKKILLFLPRLIATTVRFILTKIANTALGSKIKLLQKWCNTQNETPTDDFDDTLDYDYSDDWDEEDRLAAEELTEESYVIESNFNKTLPWDPSFNYSYDNVVNIGSFKKINKLSVDFVNLCNEVPPTVDTLVALSLTITKVMDQVYEDAKKNGAVDLMNQQRLNDTRNRVKSHMMNTSNMNGLDSKQQNELIKNRVKNMSVNRGSFRSTPNQNRTPGMDMKILGGYANPFDPKWGKYFLNANVKPYDVQRECTKIEKIIGAHTIKVSKLYEELNKVIPTINKNNLKVSKSHVMAINPNKKDVTDAMQYINSIRQNMLHSAKSLDIAAKRLEQMNPQRYRNSVMDVSYLIKHYTMMYNDCTKLSTISKIIVNHLVDTINKIIEITGNSENVIQKRADIHVKDDNDSRRDRLSRLRARRDQLYQSLQYTNNRDAQNKIRNEIDRINNTIRKIQRNTWFERRKDSYTQNIRNSNDPYGTNRLRTELESFHDDFDENESVTVEYMI